MNMDIRGLLLKSFWLGTKQPAAVTPFVLHHLIADLA